MADLTPLYKVDIDWNGYGPIYVYKISHTGSGGAVQVRTPDAHKSLIVIALQFSDSGSGVATLYSGTDDAVVLDLASNQGSLDKIDNGFILATEMGKAFKLDSTNAAVYTAWVVEAGRPKLGSIR